MDCNRRHGTDKRTREKSGVGNTRGTYAQRFSSGWGKYAKRPKRKMVNSRSHLLCWFIIGSPKRIQRRRPSMSERESTDIWAPSSRHPPPNTPSPPRPGPKVAGMEHGVRGAGPHEAVLHVDQPLQVPGGPAAPSHGTGMNLAPGRNPFHNDAT